ncbi:plasmid segregation protein ParM [Lachnospiraceae bacterium PF1-21]
MIIGVDNGYGYVKTRSTIELNGVEALISEPATADNVLYFDGKYYTVGEHRLPYMSDKTYTDMHYLSTLAAIGRELKQRGTNNAEIILAQGLPYEFYGAQKDNFKKYMLRNPEVKFNYSGTAYSGEIKDCIVYPQCLPIICQLTGTGKKVGVDIGSGTVDVVVYLNNRLMRTESFTIPKTGTIYCMEQVQNAFVSKYNTTIDEWIIQEIMINGTADIDQEYIDFITSIIKKYVTENILNELDGRGIDIKFIKIVFCGGGAVLVKRYGGIDSNLVEYEENIKANAVGYEELTKALLKNKH